MGADIEELAEEFDEDAVEGTIHDQPAPAHGAFRRIETRSGPLPDAAELARYREVDESFPREILAMAKAEQAHRHEMNRAEMQVVKEDLQGRMQTARTGQWLGFGIAALVLVLSGIMALTGHEVLASILAGVDVIGLAAVFVGTKIVQRSTQDAREADDAADE